MRLAALSSSRSANMPPKVEALSGPRHASRGLVRIGTRAGHGAGKPLSKRIEEQTDTWSFLYDVFDMTHFDPSPLGGRRRSDLYFGSQER